MSVNNYAVLRDHDRLSKRKITSLGECGQSRGWDREMMPKVAWMRPQFVYATIHELALDAPNWAPIFDS
jgi:hypothetical protein